ncbi:MAG: hypothetical protein IKE43_09470 [Coriobacteriales bacterium]|nr:hypothetical protein [Coriobacteriales bacterium]
MRATVTKLELNHDGFSALMSSSAAQEMVKDAAQRVASKAGNGFKTGTVRQMGFGRGRVGCTVYAATKAAREAESNNKALSRAVGGGI